MGIKRKTIIALHYVGFLIVNYLLIKYPREEWIFIVLIALWTFFFSWGLNYLNERRFPRIRIQKNTIVSLHYMALLSIFYIKYHQGTWIYLFLIPLWTFFFSWGLDYLNKRYYSRKLYYLYLAIAFLTGGLVAYVMARIVDTIAARKEEKLLKEEDLQVHQQKAHH